SWRRLYPKADLQLPIEPRRSSLAAAAGAPSLIPTILGPAPSGRHGSSACQPRARRQSGTPQRASARPEADNREYSHGGSGQQLGRRLTALSTHDLTYGNPHQPLTTSGQPLPM